MKSAEDIAKFNEAFAALVRGKEATKQLPEMRPEDKLELETIRLILSDIGFDVMLQALSKAALESQCRLTGV